jgi:hypothetical protein
MDGQDPNIEQAELSLRLAQLSPTKQALLENRAAQALLRKRQQKDQARISQSLHASSIRPVPRDGDLPLTFLLEHQLEQLWADPSDHDLCSTCLRLTGTFDQEAMQKTINELARRYEILRTKFPLVDGRVTQIIAPFMTVEMPMFDLKDVPETKRLEAALRVVEDEVRRPYDPGNDTLWRVALIRCSDNDHLLLLNISHIISDGWSWDVLIKDCLVLYQSFSSDNPPVFAAPSIQFADFAHWQRTTLQGQVLEHLVSYWRQRLAGLKLIPEIRLPIERPLPTVTGKSTLYVAAAFEHLRVPAAMVESLKILSRREGVTLYMLLLAALVTILHRYTGGDDFGIPSQMAKRYRPETRDVFGPFVDMLVLRIKLTGNDTFGALVQHVRDVVLEAYEHQDLPFILFDGNTQEMWGNVNYPSVRFHMEKRSEICGEDSPGEGDEVQIPGLVITSIDIPTCTDQSWDLPGFSIEVQEKKGELLVTAAYEQDRYDTAAMLELLENYRMVLEGAVDNPLRRLSEFPFVMKTSG